MDFLQEHVGVGLFDKCANVQHKMNRAHKIYVSGRQFQRMLNAYECRFEGSGQLNT